MKHCVMVEYPRKSLNGSDWNLASISKGHPSPNFDLGEDENNKERKNKASHY